MNTENLDFTTIPRKGPKCLECHKRARIGTGAETYPDEPHLHNQPMWVCECGAYARCKAGTFTPIGYPSSRKTRQLQTEALRKYTAYCLEIQNAGRSACAARDRAKKDYRQATGNKGLKFQSMHHSIAMQAIEVFSRRPPCVLERAA